MPANQLMRPQFFEGQYLGAEDLTAALDYSRIASARHLLGAHTWGIAIGLGIKEIDGPGGEVLVFIQPGFAWDGFGRPIVLLTPASIPADLFKSLVYDPLQDEPDGRMVEVWLRYREIPTQEPAAGFASCTPGNDFARALETFTIEVGQRDDAAQHDNIIVAGASIRAEEAFHAFDPADPLIPDASIPHQTFPEAGANQRWLIPLGYVRWRPNPIASQPGQFKKSPAADKDKTAAFRVLIGSVSSAIQAPEGVLRLKSRTVSPSLVASPDLVWVEGDLRVQGNARLFGSKAILVMPSARTKAHQWRFDVPAPRWGVPCNFASAPLNPAPTTWKSAPRPALASFRSSLFVTMDEWVSVPQLPARSSKSTMATSS